MTHDRRKPGIGRRTLLSTALAAPALIVPRALRAQAPTQAAPRRGGTLNMILNPEPPVLVLGVNNQGPTLAAASKIYQGLLRYNFRLEPQPELAKSWTLSPDGTTYTFQLQENVKWHDGRPLTADDVVFSITKFHMELSPRSRPIFQRITEVTATGPTTVVIKIREPFEPFLLMFDVTATAIVPKHIYDGTDYRNNPANATPIGTGPFKFNEWRRGNYVHLTRFPEYWRSGQPYLDEIYYRIVPDSASRGLALQGGQVQLTQSNDIEPFDVPRFQQMQNLAIETRGWEYYGPLSWIELNHRVAPLGDARFRRALSMAVDRNFILQRLWFNVGKVATGPISSATRFHDPGVRLDAYNPREAMALLDSMGLRPDAQGVRARLKFLHIPYGEVWTRLGEYLRQAFAQIGVQLTMESVDAGAWARRIGEWDYEMSINFVYQWGDPTLGVERTYVSSNIQRVTFTNTAGYANPQVDALFERGRTAAQAAQRQAAFSELQRILVADMPLIWLMELSFPTIYDKRLTNVVTGATGVQGSFDDVAFG
jgi:peptide/nickel transport system substrate-binding protein